MEQIVARRHEKELIENLYGSQQAEFLAIYGRRRVGKTFLIRHLLSTRSLYFELTGLKGGSLKQQLYNFEIEFKRVFPDYIIPKKVANWLEALNLLREAIGKEKSEERIILFFDELPWLAAAKSGFLPALDHFWNRYFSDDARIFLIVCGSAASWMINKIVRHKGGLHGRLTANIRLLPFDLAETEQFLASRHIQLDRKQVVDIYMAIGGVAKYLTYLKKGYSSIQLISQLCFNGPLYREFDELYSSLFENYARHVAVVKALAEQKQGLTYTEIAAKTQLSSGGGLNTILKELEASGFIVPILPFGKKKKDTRYRLVDEYTLFYLQWISQAKSVGLRGADEEFWLRASTSPAGRAWSGHAFEALCLKQIKSIKKALQIGGISTRESQWSYTSSRESDDQGAQIDLLIDRADNCINLCEIKYSDADFQLEKKYAAELLSKKRIFIEKTATRKSVFLTFISPHGIKNKNFAFGIIHVELTLDALFV